MDRLLGSKSLPPGFRFHPTDEELCVYYLKRKVIGKPLGGQMMSEVDVYKFAPWDLPSKACIKTRDLNWYFFCPRERKYVHGGRTNRATECGYWKSTGTDRNVQHNCRTVGKIKTLVFYRGKPPKGERTDWVMHEYRLEDQVLVDMGVSQDAFVVCKVYEKSGPGPRNGEHHGAQFVEEEWESDDDDNVETGCRIILQADHTAARQDAHASSAITASDNSSSVTKDTCNVIATASTALAGSASQNITPVASFVDASAGTSAIGTAAVAASSIAQQEPLLVSGGHISSEFADDELDRLLATFTADEPYEANKIRDSDIFNGLENLADGYIELDDLE